MKSSLKKIKDCKVRLTVEVEAKLVEDRFQQIFHDIQRIAKLPGFREGKVPLEMVQKKYQAEAHEEVLKSLIPEAYHRSVAEQKVVPVTLPTISDVQMERGKPMKFAAEFEKEPEVSVKNYKGIKIQKASGEVSEQDVDKGMGSLLDSRAELSAADERPVQKGDFVLADVEIWQDGEYKPNRKGVLLNVEPNEGDNFYEKILGASRDEVREVSVADKPAYKVWVRGVKEKKQPHLNEEFAKSFGKETVEELREAVRKDLARQKQSESYEKMKAQLYTALLKITNFELPEGLVAKQKERLTQQAERQYRQIGMPESGLKEALEKVSKEISDKAQEQVRLYFIMKKISENENIEVDEEELEKRLQGLVRESGRPLDEVRRVFEEDLRESMIEAKTVEFLLANAKLEDTTQEVKK